MNHDKIFQTVTANGMREMTLERFKEAIGMLWTSPCICPPDEKTGETLCCNHCGKPTARTESKELPNDDDAGLIAVNVASNVKPKLTTQEEAFFIAGFTECVKYFRVLEEYRSQLTKSKELPSDDVIDEKYNERQGGFRFVTPESNGSRIGAKWMRSIASPLLASKDARIRELEEENKNLTKANEFLEQSRSEWAKTVIKLKATPQPKIRMITACGMFEINPMFSSATLCKNCGKEKSLHLTPPKN